MQMLSKNQEQMRTYFKSTFGTMFPFGTTLEQMSKQNLAMFERAMRMFSPFPGVAGQEAATEEAIKEEVEKMAAGNVTPIPTPATSQAVSAASTSGEEVHSKIAALQKQLADLAKK